MSDSRYSFTNDVDVLTNSSFSFFTPLQFHCSVLSTTLLHLAELPVAYCILIPYSFHSTHNAHTSQKGTWEWAPSA